MVLLSALSLVVLATLASSTPTPHTLRSAVVLPVRKSNVGTISAKELVEHDAARLSHYNQRNHGSNGRRATGTYSGPVSNEEVSYTAEISVCGQSYQLIVDTRGLSGSDKRIADDHPAG